MNENYNSDDTFLGRWIAGTLTEEERIAFEKTKEFKQFQLINREAELLEGPAIDTNAALEKVKQQIQQEKPKPKVIRMWYAVAATVILLIGLGTFLNSSKTYRTGIGEKMLVTLNDGSTVNLNANSRLSHKRFFWTDNKEVELTGEGYFTVVKGEGFKVTTAQGHIEVLGTQFNVQERKDQFKVACYEGKVQFTRSIDDVEVLTKGQQVTLSNNSFLKENFNEEKEQWLLNKSTFENVPLHIVLNEFEQYYPVTFDTSKINTKINFTGSFSHSDLEIALQTVLLPMKLKFVKKGNTLTLSE